MSIPESVRTPSTEGLTALPDAEYLAAWRSLYEQFQSPLGGYVLRLLRRGRCYDPPDHVLDVRQETWFRVARWIHQCDRSPVGWLFRIARNTSLDHLKACAGERSLGRAYRETLDEGEFTTADAARLYSPEELYLLRIIFTKQLERLSAEQLQVLQLRYAGFSYEDIYLRTGVRPANARQMFHRAKLIIRSIAAEEVH